MAFTVVQETVPSRSSDIAFDKQSATLEFIGFRSTDDAIARAAFISAIPLVFENLLFQNFTSEHIGGGVWTATANYSSRVSPENPGQGGASPPPPPPPPPANDEPVGAGWAFDISVDTETIYQAKETISQTPRTGFNFADPKNAIGATPDGEVKGCEKAKAKVEFTITRTFGFVTTNYIRTLARVVGTSNDDTFFGFAAGEVLCAGASGDGKDLEKVAMTFKFWVEMNKTNIEICDGLIVPAKDGWHYIDVHYSNVKDTSKLTMQPIGAYVFRIYDEEDFGLLGIGG